MKKIILKNDVVKNLKTNVKPDKVKISFGEKLGMGYDGCGTHTHGYGIQSVVIKEK